MQYPYLSPPKQTVKSITAFGGYHPRGHIADGEWYEMENLSNARFPLACPRGKRGAVTPLFQKGGALFAKDLLWLVKNRDLVGIDPQTGEEVHTFSSVFYQPPTLVGFGAYLVDMAGGNWFSTLPNEQGTYAHGQFAYDISPQNTDFSVCLCDEQGEFLLENHFGVSPPQEKSGGMLWVDTTHTPAVIKRYYEDSSGFFPLKSYLRITLQADLSPLKEGDMVELTLPEFYDEQGNSYGVFEATHPFPVLLTGKNPNGSSYLVVEGSLCGCVGYARNENSLTLSKGVDITTGLTCCDKELRLKNPLPLLDYVVESGNRLWGCRYGQNRKGEFVNEIYASALGSFRVWEKFQGIADDSYTLSCGTDGPFTAAAVVGGSPVFFKEKVLHRVYGTFPFTVTPTPCNGVKAGFGGSAQVVNNTLYYVSRGGICAYNGAVPKLLSFPLSDSFSFGTAGGNQTHYYLYLQGEGKGELLVYDTQKGIFTKETAPFLTHTATLNNQIYASTTAMEGRRVLCLTAPLPSPLEEEVEWMGQTALFGASQKGGRTLRGLELSLHLPAGSTFSVQVQYDTEDVWHPLVHLQGGNGGYFTLPLRLRTCHTFRLKLYGKGDFTLQGIHQVLGEGGKGLCI